jgi:APA family basic amino acid/polyamine antiporter
MTRKLGVVDATVIGLGSMIGAGVFVVFAPAAGAAGTGLLIGLVVAAGVAYCNATSSAQLAAQYPVSGGTYVYGRERLGPWPGFVAGWCFVIGKTASCAAMALTFAAYAAPDGWGRPVAVVAVLALAGVNLLGVSRTVAVTRVLVALVLLVLALVAVAGLAGSGGAPGPMACADVTGGPYGVLQSAGLLFFAFAGYARIATLGEEVKDPGRTIPRAITTALAIVVVVYASIGGITLAVLGPHRLAASAAPLVDVATAGGWEWAGPLVRVGAAAAALGALLGLIAGVGRTSLAMARHSDLPRWLAAVHPRYDVPHRAESIVAVVVCALVLTVDVRGVIGFSSLGVLVYYLIANLSALTQSTVHRRFAKALQVTGSLGCGVLVVTLPPVSIVSGVAVILLGIVYRLWMTSKRGQGSTASTSAI